MEIHRRGVTASGARNSENGGARSGGSAPRGTTASLAVLRARPANPYSADASTSLTDLVLIRSMQLLLILACLWFVSIVFAADEPSRNAAQIPPTQGSSNASNSKLRRPQVQNSPNLDAEAIQSTRNEINIDDAIQSTRKEIGRIRQRFYTRYGGQDEATAMLRRGLRTFGEQDDDSSLHATAVRFLRSIIEHESSPGSDGAKFVMSFAGYSVTVGRGNHWSQSYPFVMEGIVKPILEMAPFGIELTVRNAAIGGIPSFPYGWCLSNFLGDDSDSVSWDYGKPGLSPDAAANRIELILQKIITGMNEGNGASGLESYVRQSLMLPKSPPLFILLDMKGPRLNLLQQYSDLGYLPDSIALGGRDAVSKELLSLPESDRPEGLKEWDVWGAPKGAPGQSPWHPKKKEHELMGWILAIRMLNAVDRALEMMKRDTNWRQSIPPINALERRVLPRPINDQTKSGAGSMLNGTPFSGDDSKWQMNKVSCRTSFLPTISGKLESIVESGLAKDDEDMLQARDDSLYDGSWVMDVGKLERDTKIKVQKYGGLGYIDMKTALYGIPSSGTLRIKIPHERHADEGGVSPSAGESADKYFHSVVLCEVNEKRGDDECKMTHDLDIKLGGESVPKSDISQVKGVASYLKKDICIRIGIPAEATILLDGQEPGLLLEITVSGKNVSRENGACSISHVIWENKR